MFDTSYCTYLQVGVILSNKSLLIFNVTATTAGRYQCIGWYSGDAVNGTASYDVTVTNPSKYSTVQNNIIIIQCEISKIKLHKPLRSSDPNDSLAQYFNNACLKTILNS